MCRMIYLLSDRRLPDPTDDPDYPGLTFRHRDEYGQESTRAAVRRVAPAGFVYEVSPGGYCGCYFSYETPDELDMLAAGRAVPDAGHAGELGESEAMHRCRVDAVKSFGRYLSANADASLAVYVAWEGDVGRNEPLLAFVPPSYFDGPGFRSLPEDLLLTIIAESDDATERPWDAAAPRTHEWLRCERE